MLLFREKKTEHTTEVVRHNNRARGLSAAERPEKNFQNAKKTPVAPTLRIHALGMPNIKGSGTIPSRLFLRRRRSASEGWMDSKSAICAARRARG